MSHTFVIDGVHALDYAPVIAALPFEAVGCAGGTGPDADGAWPLGSLYLYADRLSCRPVECHYDGERIEVRILPVSSPEDHRLALALSAAIAARYGVPIESTDVEPMDAITFRERHDDAWVESRCRDALSSLIASFEESGPQITVAGAHRDLRIGPRLMASLAADSEDLIDDFFERFRRLQYIDRGEVFLAPAVTLQNQAQTRKVTIAVISEGSETALSDEVDAIVLRGREGGSEQVDRDTLISLLGEQIRPLSEELLLIDAQEGPRWRELLEAAAAHRLDDLFAAGEAVPGPAGEPGADDAEVAPLEAQDRDAMAMGPFLAFLLVAGVDGPVDRQEASQFTRSLAAAIHRTDGLVREVFTEALEHFGRYLAELKGEVQIVARLRSLAGIVERCLPPGPSASYRMGLLLLAREVAESSGGGPLGLGDKVSERQQKAIAALAVLLGLAN